jgi:HK97 gp10 family phage protein
MAEAVKGIIKLEGVAELHALLKGMDAKLAKKIYRTALREGAKEIQAEAVRNAPVDTGLTRDAIKVKARKRSRKNKGSVGVLVTVGEGDYKGETFYASFVEFGHFQGSRKLGDERTFVPPDPFMRRAFDSEKENAAQMVVAALQVGIEREAAKP